MKMPKPGSYADKIFQALYKNDAMSSGELMAVVPNLPHRTIRECARDWRLSTRAFGSVVTYALPSLLRAQMFALQSPGEDAPRPIVQPCKIDRLNRPEWRCNISAEARRHDAGPAHDIRHLASGTAPESKLRGVQL